MSNDPSSDIIAYHEATKHHFHRFAKSSGFMDWANQPEPFRTFEGTPSIPLPLLGRNPDAAHEDLYARKNNPVMPFSPGTIGGFLELSMGLSAWKGTPAGRWSLRINPSSGNLHPTEAHLVLPHMNGLEAGVYHYNPFMHALEQRALLSEQLWRNIVEYFKAPGFMAALSSIYWRESWKYGERAFRYCNHDVGHALACLSFSANLFGWKVVCLNGLSDREIGIILGFDKTDWTRQDQEHADMLCYIFPSSAETGKRDLPPDIAGEFGKIEFFGTPNRLSTHYLPWERIEKAGQVTEKPRTEPALYPFRQTPFLDTAACELSAAEIIRQRRSAQAFDRNGSISSAQFFAMLDKTLPRENSAPFDSDLSPPRIHLFVFVHNVDGLHQGLYLFLRNNEDAAAIRSAARADFFWDVVKEDFPLYMLQHGDFRTEAATVSCHQEIAGESAFSLGMIARFREEIETAPHRYKSLFWESGMIGQVLYLEAEAFGVRGTGIGCFFDDAVHEMLGFSGNRFQSLYHFTVGEHIEDSRLKTLPPYHHLGHAGRSR